MLALTAGEEASSQTLSAELETWQCWATPRASPCAH